MDTTHRGGFFRMPMRKTPGAGFFPNEVAAWFEAPVDFVFDPANHSPQSAHYLGQERRYIEIMWQQHRIWGVTAAIINNLSKRIAWHD